MLDMILAEEFEQDDGWIDGFLLRLLQKDSSLLLNLWRLRFKPNGWLGKGMLRSSEMDSRVIGG